MTDTGANPGSGSVPAVQTSQAPRPAEALRPLQPKIDPNLALPALAGARRFLIVGWICVAIAILGNAAELWQFKTVTGLVQQYGYGQVPMELLSNVAAYDKFYYLGIAVGWIGLGICIFGAMYKIRRAQEHAGITGYRFTWIWTVLTIFIPIVSLFRPWQGFAEIRRVALSGMPPGLPVEAGGRPPRFSGSTFVLGLLVFLFIIGSRISVAILDEMPAPTAETFFPDMNEYAVYYVFSIVSWCILVAYTSWYLSNTIQAMRKFLAQKEQPAGI
jgi:hypothetical protein